MKSPDGRTVPTWKQLVSSPNYPPPPAQAHADVCIVGAGIAGLMSAYLLSGEGKSVIVLDERALLPLPQPAPFPPPKVSLCPRGRPRKPRLALQPGCPRKG